MSNSRTKNKRRTKASVSSKAKKKPKGLGWSQTSRNAKTLRKIEKATADEAETSLAEV